MDSDNHKTTNSQYIIEKLEDLQYEVDTLSAELAEIYNSKSWRLIILYRRLGYQYKRTRQLLNTLTLKIRSGAFPLLIRKTFRVFQDLGISGVTALVNEELIKVEKPTQDINETLKPALEKDSYHLINKVERPGILFISHEATRTGAPVFLLTLLRYLTGKLDMEFYILLRRGGELIDEFQKIGTTIVLDVPERIDALTMHNLKKRNIKLIYSNTITNGLIQKQLKRLNCPILCHVHELSYSIKNFFGDDNAQYAKATTSLFLAGSNAVLKSLTHDLNIPKEKIILSYPFIKAKDNHLLTRNDTLLLNDIPKDTLVIGACGTITWRKGPDIFLQVARQVISNANRPVAFVWVGGPLYNKDYFNLHYDAKMMGIDKQVIFTGNVSSHIRYLSHFDIFLLTSREDPFPLVALDAASLSIPIVCFNQAGGTPELVESDAGIVVPYLEVDTMATALLKLMQNDSLRQEFGKCAQKKVLERHDSLIGGEHILKIIKQQLGD